MINGMKTFAVAFCFIGQLVLSGPAQAMVVTNMFLFGDSFTDTGNYGRNTNGTTGGAYMAELFGIPMTGTQNNHPGTSGVNFAESGSGIVNGPLTSHPFNLTGQVAKFASYVNRGALSFDPNSTLFFLMGGLNDPARLSAPGKIESATKAQVQALYNLGARYFEIALIPSTLPAFKQAAANVNPVMRVLVPQLQLLFPDAVIHLSQWGQFYDEVYLNAADYGITNTTTPCRVASNNICNTPDSHYYYYPNHPSDAVHRIVGQKLYTEALALPVAAVEIPEPATWVLMATVLLAWVSRKGFKANSPALAPRRAKSL